MKVKVLKPFLIAGLMVKPGDVIEVDKANLAHYKQFGMVQELFQSEEPDTPQEQESTKQGRKKQ